MLLIAARLYIHKEELYDLCEFDEYWRESSHFNAFTADWPTNRICFMNPPYSQTSPAIYKAILEFSKGKNVVLLVKYTSAVEAAKFKYECLLSSQVSRTRRSQLLSFTSTTRKALYSISR